MNVKSFIEIKWYHVVIALLGIFVLLFVLLWIFLARTGPGYFHEDKTDIVT